MTGVSAALLAELPATEPVEVPGGFGASAATSAPAKKRSGTSGAERRRRAKATTAEGAPDAAPGKTPTARRPVPRAKPLADRLTQSVTVVGVGVGLLNQADGLAIVNGAPALGDALSKLADENPRVRKALEGAMAASAWGGVLAATLPIAATIAANHGALPAGMAEAMFAGPAEVPAAEVPAPRAA